MAVARQSNLIKQPGSCHESNVTHDKAWFRLTISGGIESLAEFLQSKDEGKECPGNSVISFLVQAGSIDTG